MSKVLYIREQLGGLFNNLAKYILNEIIHDVLQREMGTHQIMLVMEMIINYPLQFLYSR
jgi:hypothetical protein